MEKILTMSDDQIFGKFKLEEGITISPEVSHLVIGLLNKGVNVTIEKICKNSLYSVHIYNRKCHESGTVGIQFGDTGIIRLLEGLSTKIIF